MENELARTGFTPQTLLRVAGHRVENRKATWTKKDRASGIDFDKKFESDGHKAEFAAKGAFQV